MHDFICEYCGKSFSDVKKVRQFCSKHCARMAQRERKENGEGNERISKVRPFTPDTVYLILKWHEEGMKEETIAEVLNRPLEVIVDVLNGNGGEYEVEPFKKTEVKVKEEPVKKKPWDRSHLNRAVKCVETGVIYASRKEAAEKTGVNIGGISHCCLGQTLTAGGYHWVDMGVMADAGEETEQLSY